MIVFHVLLALIIFLVFTILGHRTGYGLFIYDLRREIDKSCEDATTDPRDGVLRPAVRVEYRILSLLVAACSNAWKRCEKEPPNFLRLQFESPDPNAKVGTWYLILHKREDYNPFDHIDELNKKVEKLEKESAEWQADFVNVSGQLKTCQGMLDNLEEKK